MQNIQHMVNVYQNTCTLFFICVNFQNKLCNLQLMSEQEGVY